MTVDKPNILLVDDEQMNRDALSRRLAKHNYNVALAASGPEALALVKKQPFDLVLLDVMMPEMDGLEVLTSIRENYSLSEMPIIMVTARDQSADVVAALQMGANDYVTKPINFPVILARIQTQLQMRMAKATQRSSTIPAGFVQSSEPQPLPPPAAPARPQASQEEAELTSSPGSSATDDTVRAPQFGVSSKPPVVPGYDIMEEIGRGGMGVVYKAKHQSMNRLVALKVIDGNYLRHGDAVQRFYREVQAAAQLTHANIVVAYDAGQAGDTHFLAMEFVEGTDLGKVLKRWGALPVAQVARFGRQVALGLQHAHERGLVHRDIKPSNLLVTHGGRVGSAPLPLGPWGHAGLPDATVKILDMGLALLHEPTEPGPAAAVLTSEGRWVGTPDYIAPEQAVNPHRVDIRADLYSLGCTLYHLATGQVPFPNAAPMEKILQHNLADPVPVEKLRPDLPRNTAEVIRRLMAKRPDKRYRTPAEVVEVLP